MARPPLGSEYGDGAGIEAPTPLELGLWSSVHLDKGCYMGQEVPPAAFPPPSCRPPATFLPPSCRPPAAVPLPRAASRRVPSSSTAFRGILPPSAHAQVLSRLARVKRPKRALYGIRFDDAAEAPTEAGAAVELVDAAEGAAEGAVEGAAADASGGSGAGTSLLSGGGAAVVGVLTSVAGASGLAMVRPSLASVGARVSVDGAVGKVVELAAATRFGQQAGGGAEAADGKSEADVEAAAAAAAAEAERKKKKLEAMAAKMKALGLA